MTASRAARGIALVVGAVCLALGAVAFALFARLLALPLESGRSQAFVMALFFFAMGGYLVRVGRMGSEPERERAAAARGGDASRETRMDAVPVVPVPVPPEEIELADGEVAACLRCGAARMRPLTLADGLAFGTDTLTWVCDRCNYKGAPLHFMDPTAYRAFVKGLHEERALTVIVREDG